MHFESEMPFKMHKIIFFSRKKIIKKKICVKFFLVGLKVYNVVLY